MATFAFPGNDSPTSVDYSILDGRITRFVCEGELLFDAYEGVNEPGWYKRAVKIVRDYELHRQRPVHAFVLSMIRKGDV